MLREGSMADGVSKSDDPDFRFGLPALFALVTAFGVGAGLLVLGSRLHPQSPWFVRLLLVGGVVGHGWAIGLELSRGQPRSWLVIVCFTVALVCLVTQLFLLPG
jgi:hypothetical protein